jgi:hypothetical protein
MPYQDIAADAVDSMPHTRSVVEAAGRNVLVRGVKAQGGDAKFMTLFKE